MTIQGYRITGSRLTPLDHAASTLDELTNQLPDGFYTTFSTLLQGTRVLGLRSHLERLYKPAHEFGLHPAADELELRRQIAWLAKSLLPNESRIRLILTMGNGDMYLGIQPLIPPPESVYREGVRVITADMARRDPRIKGTNFIAQSAEQRKLLKGDVYEILLTKNGRILEGMTSNFYAVKGRTLVTARNGILLGVTRRMVLRLARGEGMSVGYRPPRVDDIFDEAFITSSSRGVVPVVKVNASFIGRGRVGAWTKRLSLAYQACVRERGESIIQG